MSDYYAFMLRIWRDENAEQWRASVEDAHSAEKLTFKNPEQLSEYLTALLKDGDTDEPKRNKPATSAE